MRRGGFPIGYELPGQIFIRGAHQKDQVTAARSHLYVFGLQNERDCATHSGEAVHIHGQLCPPQRIIGNYLISSYL